MLFFYCIKHFGAARAAMADYVAPIVASLGGVLLLSEEITWGMVTGIVIIALGITLLNYRQRVATPESI
jgi:drug/metabolite transporter (DMT)-like permease